MNIFNIIPCIYEMSNLSINLKKTIILRIKLSFKFLKDACRLMAQIHKLYSRGKLNKSYSSESNPVTAYNSVTVRDWTGNCKWITPEACTWTHISKTVLKIYVKKKKKKRRIRKGIKKKTCLSSHNQLNEIVTTSRARVQKTPQLLSFRMRAHGVYRNTHDKPLIYSGYDITLFHKTRGDGIGGTYRYRHARATWLSSRDRYKSFVYVLHAEIVFRFSFVDS